jgi:cation diffusion facilitator family transporter
MSTTVSSRAIAIRRILWIVLALNVFVTLIKLLVGLATGSLSAIADGTQSAIDAASNIIGLVGMWVSTRPPDDNHPYGHHKYEAVTALGIGALSLMAAYEISRSVITRLMGSNILLSITPLTVGLMALTFVVNLGITLYETRLGRRLQSHVLLADAAQTRANLFITVSVITSLVAAQWGLPWLDSLVALVIVVVLLYSVLEILRSTSNVLTDVAAADPKDVEQIALSVPNVSRVDGIRSRGHADAVYIDLHVQVHPQMGTEQAHSVASEVERRIAERLPGVVETLVHVEPARSEEPASLWQELSLTLRNVADGMGVGLHDLHAHVEKDGGYSVELHLEVDASLKLGQAHALADEFEQRVRKALPAVRSLTTHIEPLATILPDEAGLISQAQAEDLRRRITQFADGLAGPGTCHSVELHNVNGHLTATLHITQPAEQLLTDAHALAEAVEQAIQAHEHSLHHIIVHVEPPEQDE